MKGMSIVISGFGVFLGALIGVDKLYAFDLTHIQSLSCISDVFYNSELESGLLEKHLYFDKYSAEVTFGNRHNHDDSDPRKDIYYSPSAKLITLAGNRVIQFAASKGSTLIKANIVVNSNGGHGRYPAVISVVGSHRHSYGATCNLSMAVDKRLPDFRPQQSRRADTTLNCLTIPTAPELIGGLIYLPYQEVIVDSGKASIFSLENGNSFFKARQSDFVDSGIKISTIFADEDDSTIYSIDDRFGSVQRPNLKGPTGVISIRHWNHHLICNDEATALYCAKTDKCFYTY